MFFGGQASLPTFLARPTVLGIVVDPSAAVLVFIITGLLCTGIKEVLFLCKLILPYLRSYYFFISKQYACFQSSLAQAVITTINVIALLFIIVAGGYVGFKTQWVGYQIPGG